MTTQPFISFAQNHEDVVLFRALGHIEHGRYIDVGANDPTADSVTKAFYDRGWRGMSIEPVPAFAEAHRDQRPGDLIYEVAVTNSDVDTVTLYEVPETGLSSLHRNLAAAHQWRGLGLNSIQVKARKLADILAEAEWDGLDIHFLSVDVEGAEVEVLAGTDLQKWRPWVLVIEALEPDTAAPSHERWQGLVEAAGYRFALFDGLNRFFIAAERWADLHPRLSTPANVLDHYETYRVVTLGNEIARLRDVVDLVRGERSGLQDRCQSLAANLQSVSADRQRVYRHAESLGQAVEEHRDRERKAIQASVVWRKRAVSEWANAAVGVQRPIAAELEELRSAVANLSNELSATRATLSWRITRPIRAIRRVLWSRGRQ